MPTECLHFARQNSLIRRSRICFQLVDQNSALKKEAGIAERKLLARNERIQNLEALLQDADRRLAMQNQKFEAQLQAVKERLDQARGELSFIAFRLSPSPNVD